MLNPSLNQASNLAFDAHVLMQKIQQLPPERMLEVGDFVEFLQQRSQLAQAYAQDRDLTRQASQISQDSFAVVWNNAEDEAYDAI
ncbi:MAG: DUF2281 domain-containing protein [Polaromonas sp.]